MKTLVLSATFILAVTFNAAASTAPVNEKAENTFRLIFKDAGHVQWSAAGNLYEAFFIMDDIKTRATIDAKGNLIQTIRYYSEAHLPANVLYSIKRQYRGKEIFGVTEVSNQQGVNYRVVLRDDKTYTHINAGSNGDTELVKKYKRGDK